jgi:large subunit ribosomal protein L21
MFAVVRTGGKQYRVAQGDKIVVEKLDGNAGDRVTLGDVLLAGDGGSLKSTDGLTVAAEIVAQAKADKVTVFKKRRRHNYRRKKGHRQQHTILKIVAIGDQKEQKKAAAPKAEASSPAPANADGKVTKGAEQSDAAVTGKPTENPAPAEKPAKKAAPAKAKAESGSTKNAAPAKAAAKKTPKK